MGFFSLKGWWLQPNILDQILSSSFFFGGGEVSWYYKFDELPFKKCFDTTPNMWSSHLSSNLHQIVDNKIGETEEKYLRNIYIHNSIIPSLPT
jgi:hypothetical protein